MVIHIYKLTLLESFRVTDQILLQGDFKILRKPTQTWHLVLSPSQKKRDLKGRLMEVYAIPLTKKMIEANYNSYYESMR